MAIKYNAYEDGSVAIATDEEGEMMSIARQLGSIINVAQVSRQAILLLSSH